MALIMAASSTSCSSRIFPRDGVRLPVRAHAHHQERVSRTTSKYQPLVRPHAGDDLRERPARARACPSRPACTSWAASAIYLNTRDSQLGRGEPVEDAAQVISRMSDIVMIRTFEQEIIERFAANSRVPVINGLTNEYHPCQILADIFTYIEHRGSIQGKTVAWIGDANNVCNTWLQAAEMLGFNVHVSTPPGYEVEPERAGLSANDALRGIRRPDGCRARCRPGDHRRVDLHGLRGRERRAHEGFRRLARRCRHDALSPSPTHCSCTACRRTAARKWLPR